MGKIKRTINYLLESLRYVFATSRRQMSTMNYNEYWGKKGPYEIQLRFKVFLGWLTEGSSVLDVGCGDGTLAKFLMEKKGCRVLGIDISPTAVKMCHEKGVRAIVGDITKGLNLNEVFDVAICSEVLEHIPNPEDVLDNLKHLVKNYVLISIPNIAYWPHRLRLLFGRFPIQWIYHPAEHLRFWSVVDFIHFAEGLNFKVEEVKASNGFPILYRFLPSLFGNQVCFKLKRKDR